MKFFQHLTSITLIMLTMSVNCYATDNRYDVLRQQDKNFARVLPNKQLNFPEDHLAHPGYRIEWWYITANLIDPQGKKFGIQWTLFRQSLAPVGNLSGWSSHQLWMAHAALTTPQEHLYEERFARGGIAQADVKLEQKKFLAWIDDWQLTAESSSPIPSTLSFTVKDYQIDLQLSANTPWVLQGDKGYSIKSMQGQASYYYSQPHIQVKGNIQNSEHTISVTGQAWMDREWSSQPLAPDQTGWDWLSLHLDDGHALMIYRLRHKTDKTDKTDKQQDWLSGTWIDKEGKSQQLKAKQITLQPLKYASINRPGLQAIKVPIVWSLKITIEGRHYAWTIKALQKNSWLATHFPYWEGAVTAKGTINGEGYLEMTGYDEQ